MDREEAIMRIKQNKAAAEFYVGMAQNTNVIENELKDIEAFDMAIEALSAEAVQVVRCGECMNRMKNGFCLEHVRNEKNDCNYCSYGKRRE